MIDYGYETEKETAAREAREEHAEDALIDLIDQLCKDFEWDRLDYNVEEVKDMLRRNLENKKWGRKG
jgi:hypothetical protein